MRYAIFRRSVKKEIHLDPETKDRLSNLDYELNRIGVNLNQIAAKANAMGHIDKTVFQYEANRLRRTVLDIQTAVTSPERRYEDGNNSDMGCARPP